jgi:hypothetical protein
LVLQQYFQPKLKLCELITNVRNHSADEHYCTQLIVEFASAAAKGNLDLGSEIMRRMKFYFKPITTKNNKIYHSREGDERSIAIDLMFNTLLHFYRKSVDKQRSVGFAAKALAFLRELAE